MEWYFILLIVIASILVIYCALCYVIGLKSLALVVKPRRKPYEETRHNDEANGFVQCFEQYENVWEKHPFRLQSNGVELVGEYIVNPADTGARKKVMIICHGHTVNRLCALKYAAMFYPLGYSIVIYDARYFGSSTGDWCTLGQNEEKDLLNVIAYTKSVFGQDAFIGLHGESMGAATVLLSLRDTVVNFVVADCPFASSKWLFEDQMKSRLPVPMVFCVPFAHLVGKRKYGYDFYKVNPIDAVAQTQVPICFFHGKADSYILPRHSQEMFQRCRNSASELHLVDGAEHARSCVVDAQAYEAMLDAFVRKIELTQGISRPTVAGRD